MSLKHSVVGEAHLQHSTLSSVQRQRYAKRALVHSDDDDSDGPVPSTAQRMKRIRTVDTDASLSATATPDDDDDDMDADVGGSTQHSLGVIGDTRFYPEDVTVYDHSPSYKARADTSKKRNGSSVTSVSAKKKHQVVYSEEESDGHMEHNSVEDDLSDVDPPIAEHTDDDLELDTQFRRGASKAKASASRGRPGKAKSGQPKGAKAKGPKEKEKDKEIHMKDERKLAALSTLTPGTSSVTGQSQPSELFCNEEHGSSTIMDSLPDTTHALKDSLSQTISKKRKLPPIKKTKVTSSTTSTATPSTVAQKSATPSAQDLVKPMLPTSEQRKQALTGVRDIDLADSKVYAELFKGAGGNTPRSGLKNAEERRRELDKMRDEARARRNEEAKYTFDLQSQADKIARFEQRLRVENSTVLHPNFLAAKFRDEWEMDKRSRRATPKEEGEA